MQETKQGIGPWANLPASKDPASPHYFFHPEHERLSSFTPSSITTPSIIPALPGFIAYWTGMYSMYGVTGRDSVYIVAMRRRAELLPRPFTQIEHAVLSRYSHNMQNGAEYFGLLGLAGGVYWSMKTEFWPMEKSFRTMFGLKGGATGGETVPPSGFVYPNGWGQKEGGGNAGGSTTGSGSTAANTGAPAGVPPESTATKSPPYTDPQARINAATAAAESIRGPVIPRPKPPCRYQFPLNAFRWLYMCQPPPEIMVRYVMFWKSKIESTPTEQRNSAKYLRWVSHLEYSVETIEEMKRRWAQSREGTKKDMVGDLMRLKELGADASISSVKQLETLLKEFEEFDKRLIEAKGVKASEVAGTTSQAAANATKSVAEGAAAEAAAKAKAAENESIASEAHKIASEASEAAFKNAHENGQKPNGAPQQTGPFRPGQPGSPFPPGATIYQMSPGNAIGKAVRAAAWGFFGKYVVGTIGLMWLTSRSRQKEILDERLQEYNYDRMEYAKVRMREMAARRGLPAPPSSPQPPYQQQESYGDNEGGVESRRPERFEPVDTQSLGGLQAETIDWGDLVKDDAPVAARQTGSTPIRSGESSWDRARREREGPQGPAMEEDRWAPQSQQDTAARTDDVANKSRWELIRQQASEGYSGERRVPGETRDSGENNGSFGGFGRRQPGQGREKTKEEMQAEFDAEVEKARRFEEGGWK